MAVETRISNEAFEHLALAASDVKWELWDGVPGEKPGMTAAHNYTAFELGHMLRLQLDPDIYQVRVNAGHVHRPESTYFIPDVFVAPTAYVAPIFELRILEVFDKSPPSSSKSGRPRPATTTTPRSWQPTNAVATTNSGSFTLKSGGSWPGVACSTGRMRSSPLPRAPFARSRSPAWKSTWRHCFDGRCRETAAT